MEEHLIASQEARVRFPHEALTAGTAGYLRQIYSPVTSSISSMAERQLVKLKVAGSVPAWGATPGDGSYDVQFHPSRSPFLGGSESPWAGRRC